MENWQEDITDYHRNIVYFLQHGTYCSIFDEKPQNSENTNVEISTENALPPLQRNKKKTSHWGMKNKDYIKLRLYVLQRDKTKCTQCGSSEYLHIHHIIPYSEYGGNYPSNLVTLCYKCHKERHKGQSVWYLMK